MAAYNPVTHPLVVQAIDRAALAIAYVAQPDSTVLSRHHRREHSVLEEKLRKAIPVALQACIDEVEADVDTREARRRPRRTFIRKTDNNDMMMDLLSAFGALNIRPGDSYVIQRLEDA